MKQNFNEYQKPSVLESLEDHNNRIVAKSAVQKANGIACPKCGEELFDTNSGVVFTSMPAKYAIECHKCDYIGYRF
jgi:DNA-directed RNA polymerase subunit RPC12/RpoP